MLANKRPSSVSDWNSNPLKSPRKRQRVARHVEDDDSLVDCLRDLRTAIPVRVETQMKDELLSAETAREQFLWGNGWFDWEILLNQP